jgi:cardiolipin synthase A/B
MSRTTLVLLLVLLQIGLFFLMINYVSSVGEWQTIFYAISVIIVIYIVGRNENPTYKIGWIIPILVFPLFGGAFYLFYRRRNISKTLLKRHLDLEKSRKIYINHEHSRHMNNDQIYLHRLNWPTYHFTKTNFLASGEAMFKSLLQDLKNAKKFIFLEFFIIQKGKMWEEILSILKTKVKEGVEVKIIYDDFGSSRLPYQYPKVLLKYGIQAYQFNKMQMHLNFMNNYRDHRKIVVIDNKIGYTGGNNIGDEYINLISPYGHWLDTGVRIEGDAVWSLTLAFLENYSFVSEKEVSYKDYYVKHKMESDGLITPFTDTPLDSEETTKNIYISLIQRATKSISVTTPYLIIDNEFSNALRFAAKSGVDVKIIIPFIPDKRFVYMVTESYMPELLKEGVKVYYYKPGFIHSKLMIIDEHLAMIGTANLDYRSLFLHFENSIYIENASTIKDMNHFFETTLQKSELVDRNIKKPLYYRMMQHILKTFSMLM